MYLGKLLGHSVEYKHRQDNSEFKSQKKMQHLGILCPYINLFKAFA